jgi:hypothetical protein
METKDVTPTPAEFFPDECLILRREQYQFPEILHAIG